MKKPLLFISHRIPYPPNKGEKIRSFNFLKYLSKHHEIFLACLIDDPKDLHTRDSLSPYLKGFFYDYINPRTKKLFAAPALFRNRPITNHYFYSRRLQGEIDQLTSRIHLANVFCSSSPTAEYLFRSKNFHQIMKNAATIMDLMDVDSDKWRQYADSSRWPMKWVYKKEAENLQRYEKKIAHDFSHIVLTSENEKKLFRNQVPDEGSVISIQNGVDLDFFAPREPLGNLGQGPKLVFTGVMDYHPNSEGVCWFVRAILPLIRKRIPHILFYIVGSNPTPSVQALGKEKGIEVTGFVDDIRDYIASADVCVVPLRIARGIQNKVLEAMAMQKPVVATPQALGGIRARAGEDLMVADTADAFADKVVTLLSDREYAGRLGRAARRCVEKHYSWENNLRAIDPLLV